MAVTRRRFFELVSGAGLLPRPFASRQAAASKRAVDLRGLRKPKPEERVLTLVGDVFLMKALADHEDSDPEQVFDVLRASNASFANLENGLSTVGHAEAGGFQETDWGPDVVGPSLRGDPSLVDELTWMGIDAVSLANNHTGNYGREALLETRETLDRAGIRHAGAGADGGEAFRPTFLDLDGFTLGFLSLYSCYYRYQADDAAGDGLPGIAYARSYDVLLEVPSPLESAYSNKKREDPPYQLGLQPAGAHTVLAALREDVERMREAIAEARARADFVVLSVHFHWGRSGHHDVPFQQRVLVQSAVEAGADLLVGHGPHRLAGIETYARKAIAYSLGNFLLARESTARPRTAAPRSPPTAPPSSSRESIVLRAAVERRRVVALEILPIRIGPDGRPRFDAGETGARIVHQLAGLSAPFGTPLVPTDWFGTIPV